MSNFYGGKQGFSFFISKLYVLERKINGEQITYGENEEEYDSVESFLIDKFNNDSDVHYNDYVLLGITAGGLGFNAASPYHGNLYRKDITEFKLVGNLAGPPGGASQVILLNWDNFSLEYQKDQNSVNSGELKDITPIGEDNTILNINLVNGKDNSQIKIKYYCITKEDLTTTFKVAIQSPVPYIDFTNFYKPEINGDPPLMIRDEVAEREDNLFYQPYKYPIVTKYYKPRIDNDELYGDLYEYEKDGEEDHYSYQVTKSELLGQIKQESGILIGKNIAYYILSSESGTQSDTDIQAYLNSKEKRDTLLTSAQDGYTLVINKKLICKKLNDDYPCGLGYQYVKVDGVEDKTKREIINIDLVGKIVSYGDETGPITENKIVTWFFGYDFSRANVDEEIIPNWYFLNLITSQIKIIFAEDQDTEDDIIPATAEEIKAGDLWVGLLDKSSWEVS